MSETSRSQDGHPWGFEVFRQCDAHVVGWVPFEWMARLWTWRNYRLDYAGRALNWGLPEPKRDAGWMPVVNSEAAAGEVGCDVELAQEVLDTYVGYLRMRGIAGDSWDGEYVYE